MNSIPPENKTTEAKILSHKKECTKITLEQGC